MESEKIKSPKTNRFIYIGGDAYNKLITQDGYTPEYLLSLQRLSSNKPMSPKSKNVINTNNVNNHIQNLTAIDDTNLQILRQSEDVYNLCVTNKYFYQLCMKHSDIKQKFLKEQQIHLYLKELFDWIKTKDNFNIPVVWIQRPRYYEHTGDFMIDGVFNIYYNKNKFYISSYEYGSKGKTHYSHKKNILTPMSEHDLYNMLYDIKLKYPHVKIY